MQLTKSNQKRLKMTVLILLLWVVLRMYDLSADTLLMLRALCTLQWKISFLIAYILIQNCIMSRVIKEFSLAATFSMLLCNDISEMFFEMSNCHFFKFWFFCLTSHKQLWCQILISQLFVCCLLYEVLSNVRIV